MVTDQTAFDPWDRNVTMWYFSIRNRYLLILFSEKEEKLLMLRLLKTYQMCSSFC